MKSPDYNAGYEAGVKDALKVMADRKKTIKYEQRVVSKHGSDTAKHAVKCALSEIEMAASVIKQRFLKKGAKQ